MHQGKLLELDTAEQIYKHPKTDYTRNLLAAIPKGIPKSLLEKDTA
jgi:peptide/nickel transport system ATP-binding protein